MNRRTKREIGEWAKAAIGLLMGMAFLLGIEVWYSATHFLIRKDVAMERELRDEMYTRFDVCPIDEFAGLRTNAWCMKTNLPPKLVVSDCGDIIGELAKGEGR